MEPRLTTDADVVYCFGKHRFAPRRQLLTSGETPVRVGARALDLLQLLIERQGELVSKSDLLGFAWPNTFVDESNLKVNIAALRRALQQQPGELPYIVNVPGRGYRFASKARLEANVAETLAASAPGLVRDNLPALTSPIGRDDDIAAITAAIGDRGLVTIVGPAGVGKTTLAVAAARRMAGCFPHGACFVDLAAINDPQLICAAIASALGLGAGLADLLMGIEAALRGSSPLLILDNCEHVLPTVARVAEHVSLSVPQAGIIATSREPLRIRAEHVYRLAPLPCPARAAVVDRAQAMTFPAVALFVARAQDGAGYRVGDRDMPAVAEICCRLDGVPLALELAASRLRTCDPATLLQHLDQSFELLNHGPRNAPLRHQALQTTLDWSYRLLSDHEAALLRCLSVFAGAFAAEDLDGLVHELPAIPVDIADCIGSLVSKSLVAQTAAGERAQYRLLDVTRTYARDRLQAEGEDQHVYAAHAHYMQCVYEQAEADWAWRAREDWLARYGPRANDLRKAIDWALSGGDVGLGIRLTAAAIPLWDELSSVGEGSRRVRVALEAARSDNGCDPALHIKLAIAHARSLAFADSLDPQAESVCREVVQLAEASGTTDDQLRAVWGLAVLQSFIGRHRDVAKSLDQLEAVSTRSGNGRVAPAIERFRHMTQFYRGDITGAHAALVRLARRHDKIGQTSQLSRFQIDPSVVIRTSLAFVSWVRGDTVDAIATARHATESAAATGHLVSESNALALAAIPITLWTGDLDTAERHVTRLTETLNQKGATSWWPLNRFFRATLQHRRGQLGALDGMRGAADEIMSSGFLLRAPIYVGMLAEAELDDGDVTSAQARIAAALRQAEQQDEAWCLAELLRIRGRIERRLGRHDSADETMRRALTMVGQAGALAFQLRATCDLAESWAKTGRRQAAMALLEPVCRRLSANSTDCDAERARRLLDRIGGHDVRRVKRTAISPSQLPRRPGLAME